MPAREMATVRFELEVRKERMRTRKNKSREQIFMHFFFLKLCLFLLIKKKEAGSVFFFSVLIN